ncbi:DNA-binding transcription factor yap1 [Podila epigama]|nr:DNA-binding transcription factor yap1 [Podila epigama]
MSLLPTQNDIYPVALSDNEWSKILSDNREAQDLLSNAIAHHEQFREDDASKRTTTVSHLHHKSDHYAVPKASSNGSYDDSVQYSEGDNSSDEASAANGGKPAPKKAGRKPLTTEPTNKRKAQNRAAQRAFRERKERYVKSLEDRIKELEEMNPGRSDSKLAEENMNLKVLVQKLETENYFLKEQSFTFDFPISQPGLYGLAKAQAQARAQAPPQSHAAQILASSTATTAGQTHLKSPSPDQTSPLSTNTQISDAVPTVPKVTAKAVVSQVPAQKGLAPTTYEHLPWTPPSSGGDSVPISPLEHDLPTPEQEVVSNVSFTDNAGVVPRMTNSSPEDIALFSSLLDGTGNTYSNHINTTTSFPNTTSTPTPTTATATPTQHSINNILANHTPTPTSQKLDTPSPASSMALFTDNSPSPTLDELVNTPLFETYKQGTVPFTSPITSMPSLTYEQTQALFTDFRDPSAPGNFFSSFDDPVEPKFGGDVIGGLFNDQLLDYNFANVSPMTIRDGQQHGFFGEVPTASTTASPAASGPLASVSSPSASAVPTQQQPQQQPSQQQHHHHQESHKGALAPLGEDEKAIPCPQVWEHIAKHPNFDDADIDDLCAELKAKAKCSGHGPVIALSDVDKLMNRLNQE